MLAAVCLALLAFPGRTDDALALMVPGPDFGRGTLVNVSLGAHPNTPLDPGKPTFVIVHGLNPLHPLMHFEVGERYGDALRARYGNLCNVALWNWNGVTTHGLSHARVHHRAIEQGERLAETLLAMRIDRSRLALIGQSAGCVLVASAARRLTRRGGAPVRQLTMIDPAWQEHELIFEQIQAGSCAWIVENLWVPGASGFGAPAYYANVRNFEIPGPNGLYGLLNFSESDHLHAVSWHIRWLTQ